MKKRKIYVAVTAVVIVATVGCALWIMLHRIGLQESLDFGAGAYYYADIPDFDKFTERTSLASRIPYWVYVALFLLWGWLMFLLWKWVDGRK